MPPQIAQCVQAETLSLTEVFHTHTAIAHTRWATHGKPGTWKEARDAGAEGSLTLNCTSHTRVESRHLMVPPPRRAPPLSKGEERVPSRPGVSMAVATAYSSSHPAGTYSSLPTCTHSPTIMRGRRTVLTPDRRDARRAPAPGSGLRAR